MNSDFPRIITLQRKERKISQKQAAADLGISQALLSHYEKGIRECGLDFLIKIADYYNVSCDYLLGRTSSPCSSFPDSCVHTENSAHKLKLISDSAETVISVSEKYGSRDMTDSVTDLIMTTLYKLFRIIFSSDPENDQTLFRISENCSENFSDCLISRNTAMLKKTGDHSPVPVKSSALAEEFPGASSLLSLIRNTEETIIREIPGADRI
ncbi:MAG: helix-turn-helix domain-containing protein [Porcipelethomonas sp.]